MPPSASSKRPTRSLLASVKAPRTWPNSSLSNTPSETPPEFTTTIGRDARLDTRVQRARDDALAGAVLAGDEHVRVRGPDALDDLQHRAASPADSAIELRHRPRRAAASSRPRAAAPLRSAWPSSICVRDDREQARVVPRLLDEVARAAAHRLDRDLDAAPRRHHDDRQRRIDRLNARRAGSSPSSPDVVSRV